MACSAPLFPDIFQIIIILTVLILTDRSRSSVTAPPKSSGMKLGKSGKNQLMESLKAEGEHIIEDVKPTGQTRAAVPSPTDPFTLTVEEKLSVALRRDGGISSFDVQGTLSLQILNQEDGFVQVQVIQLPFISKTISNESARPFTVFSSFFVMSLSIFYFVFRLKLLETLKFVSIPIPTSTENSLIARVFLG